MGEDITIGYPSANPHSPERTRDGETDTVTVQYVNRVDKEVDGWVAELAVRAQYGSTYSHFGVSKPWLYATRYSARKVGPGVYHVDIGYETIPEEDQEDDPLNERPKISVTSEEVEVPILETADGENRTGGEPLRNAAGQYFDPPPTRKVVNYKINVQRNLPIAAPVLTKGDAYQMAVNTDTYFGVPPGHAQYRLLGVSEEIAPATETRGPYLYLTVTEEIAVDVRGFRLKLLQRGDYYIDDEGKEITFKTADGTPRKGLIDATGNKLADGADPVFLEVQADPELAFAPLGLPQRFGGR